MKLKHLTDKKPDKKEKKVMTHITTDIPIYKDIEKDMLNKKHLTLRPEHNKLFPDLIDKELEVNIIKLSDLGDMKAWVVYFKNADDSPYLAHYFK